ncbi:arginase family protein [Eremomyces bilateralis CBS 781.70]|uniref:Arginase family protein n=1 Tax=Eremomyces bilateralis CBS 781.70 TaxID=1392243 RepID=A0A6G1FXD6_9PEZI|nr:arginase family protein [Eremomyces bilateralis CBS 781.70]KAF1810408.1 arginase family protein [Eremomyces bilateralis CBS 781.70]
MILSSVLVFAAIAHGREIVFPPLLDITQNDQLFKSLEGAGQDSGFGVAIAGLPTYANLPFINCAAKDGDDVFDIGILGAGFDTGVTARPGTRFGPDGIRQGSRRMSDSIWSIYTGKNTFRDWARIVDCGNAPLTYLDNTVALKQLQLSHKAISARRTSSSEYTTPRILTLGGDHTTTLPALRSAYQKFGQVSVIHFDSHLDTWDPKVLGGGISHYAGVNHGTFLHIAHEEGLIGNSSIHVGIRAPVLRPKGDVRNDIRCGFDMIKARDLDRIGVQGVVDKIKERVGANKVYISVDIDVLDPAFAPGTGTAEAGGWSTRELLTILDALSGLEVVGGDVVEVAPIYDNAGETTIIAAAEVAHSLLQLMVDQPVKSLRATNE